MKRYLTIFYILTVSTVVGQSKLSGTLTDERSNTPVTDAIVMLITKQDSILTSFTRSNQKGQFVLTYQNKKEQLLIVNTPTYADYYIDIKNTLTEDNLHIALTKRAILLEEVIVQGKLPLIIKGDTTEYSAIGYKTEKNATVEDLLKILPGITVDEKGKIIAQGKLVKKVLVDGEEFFGKDPTLVTKNIRADMVETVQVYERESEIARRTGIKDGEKEQTVNVKLKESAKNGLFGKAMAGIGNKKYYSGQLMANLFRGSQKLSAYGLTSNNGLQDLGTDEITQYNIDKSAPSLSNNNQSLNAIGVPRSLTAGLNYIDKFNNGKQTMNFSYLYGNIKTEGTEKIKNSGILNNSIEKFGDVMDVEHKANFKYDYNPDSLNIITIDGRLSSKRKSGINESATEVYDQLQNPLVIGEGHTISDYKKDFYNLNLLFTHKFRKIGRSISLNTNLTGNQVSSKNLIYSHNKFLATSKDSVTDQRKVGAQSYFSRKFEASFTEPITKFTSLSLSYSNERSSDGSDIRSYNKSDNDQYEELDKRFSNDFDFRRTTNSIKLAASYVSEKFKANLTNNLQKDVLNQQDFFNSFRMSRSFYSYNPTFRAAYALSKSKSVWVNYSGYNQLPSIFQIQPIRDNSDPLNQQVGNENLKPSFKSNINIGLNSSKVLTGDYMFIGGNFVFQNNPLSINIRTENGVNYFVWENISGKTNYQSNAIIGKRFIISPKADLSNTISANVSVNKDYVYFNEIINQVNSSTYQISYNLLRNTKAGLDFNVTVSPSYRKMQYKSLDMNNNGFFITSSGSINYFIKSSFKLYINYSYNYEAPSETFDSNFSRLIFSPGISRNFLKNQELSVDLSVFDAFNQNVGFSRSVINSSFTERYYDTIRRYFMIKISYNLLKNFKPI